MYWKLKAMVQKTVDRLPMNLSHPVYFTIQRWFGNLRHILPFNDLKKSVLIANYIDRQKREIINKSFIEIGTGRTLNVPIGLWLCGASKVITVDKNPYLKGKLVIESLNWIKKHRNKIEEYFGTQLYKNRLDQLTSIEYDINALLNLTNIQYYAPADASSLPVKLKERGNLIDYHFSVNVLEHIPYSIIKNIFSENKKVLTDDGLLIHLIDLSDHFSHDDKSITSINFLQFDENKWHNLAGNRLTYHNRLRVYDYYEFFSQQGIEILLKEEIINKRSLELLKKGFPVNNRFFGHKHEDLAVSNLNIVGKFD